MVGVSPAGGVCWARAAGSVRKPSAMTRTAARRARYMTISLEDREHTTVSRRLRRRIDGESETENPRRRNRDGDDGGYGGNGTTLQTRRRGGTEANGEDDARNNVVSDRRGRSSTGRSRWRETTDTSERRLGGVRNFVGGGG